MEVLLTTVDVNRGERVELVARGGGLYALVEFESIACVSRPGRRARRGHTTFATTLIILSGGGWCAANLLSFSLNLYRTFPFSLLSLYYIQSISFMQIYWGVSSLGKMLSDFALDSWRGVK